MSRQTVEAARQRWAYKVIDVSLNADKPELIANDLGNDGWDLVSVRNKGNTMEVTLYFKRPRD